jgi:hypothetical protein
VFKVTVVRSISSLHRHQRGGVAPVARAGAADGIGLHDINRAGRQVLEKDTCRRGLAHVLPSLRRIHRAHAPAIKQRAEDGFELRGQLSADAAETQDDPDRTRGPANGLAGALLRGEAAADELCDVALAGDLHVGGELAHEGDQLRAPRVFHGSKLRAAAVRGSVGYCALKGLERGGDIRERWHRRWVVWVAGHRCDDASGFSDEDSIGVRV